MAVKMGLPLTGFATGGGPCGRTIQADDSARCDSVAMPPGLSRLASWQQIDAWQNGGLEPSECTRLAHGLQSLTLSGGASGRPLHRRIRGVVRGARVSITL